METTNEVPTKEQLKNGLPGIPSREDVHKWIKRDISAASYFLSMLLRYPDIMETMAGELYAKVLEKEKGAAIDHVEKSLPLDFEKNERK